MYKIILASTLVLCGQIQTTQAQTETLLPAIKVTSRIPLDNAEIEGAAEITAAVIDIEDRTQFDNAYPRARHITFDSVANRMAPFRVSGVDFFGNSPGSNPQVLNDLINLPATYWFGAETQSSNFLLTNLVVQIRFPKNVSAMGFDIQCFACDETDKPTPINAILLTDKGEMVSYSNFYLSALTGIPAGTPGFLGIAADRPFRSIILQRSGNWLLANLRYVPVK